MINREPRTPYEKKLFSIMNDIDSATKLYGFIAFVVGGFCRDEFYKTPHKEGSDVDIMAENYRGLELAGLLASHYHINMGYHHRTGTAQLVIGGIQFDFQANIKFFEYLPEIRKMDLPQNNFTFNILSRDFTVNTLAMSLRSGKIYDITGKAIPDLKQGLLRTPLEPHLAIEYNPMIIVRAIRFAVKYGYSIDEELSVAMREKVSLLSDVGEEKIAEIIGDIIKLDKKKGEAMLRDFGILQ